MGAKVILNDKGLVIDISDVIKNNKMIFNSAASKVNNVVNDNIEVVILDFFPVEFKPDKLLGFDFLSKNSISIDF
ncbi:MULTISPECIES: hypothetical protein [unclassified Gilliamella]|uniref:hypothetical protein n=1 Tax=unclassified Gilliamella TaxID=2685620 RepID=UPI00080E0BF4|nr:hypothetical protein [Gilliamella apicola]OCG67010.1 hypothetical protein A9G30_06060 [Gilliamella apicola]OCG78475.1 hypothetical protein A9G42_03410 [Gilliamella apicola]